MKITSIEALPFRIPLKKVTEWARGKQDAAEHVLVKVYTDEGIVGIAEAPARPTIYGESLASIKFAIKNWFGPSVIGMDPFETAKIWDRFDMFPSNNTAKASIDIALHDVMGKALGMPCYKLLGFWTDRVRMSWCVNLNPVKEMLKEAEEMMGTHGFKTLKLKVGIDPDKDIEMVRTMRKELGDDVSIYVDVNQGYDPYTAIRDRKSVV
jgi:L-alanine-DL-glutamate epimerase-like enolase superfamily enzyme